MRFDRCRIIATDIVTALGVGTDNVWRSLLAGLDGIRPMLRFPLGVYITDFAAELPEEVEQTIIDAGCSRARCLRLTQYVSRTVLVNARGRIGLVLSSTKGDMQEFEAACAAGRPSGPRYYDIYRLTRDLAAELRIAGPVVAVSNACASGLAAVIQAVKMIKRGEADMMLVVGIDLLSNFVLSGFSSLAALSTRPCRPYDAARDGLSLGEAAGAILIAPASAVESQSETSTIISGWALTNDANHITSPLSTGEGLEQAIRRALDAAGLQAADIGYVNGHGTGTMQNDEMEARAINAVFGDSTPTGSIKGYIGHTLGAAAVVETALSVAAMQADIVPASRGFDSLGTSRRIFVPLEHLRERKLDHVMTLKCGFGGINAAVVLSKGGMR